MNLTSRRRFIKQMGAVLAGTALFSCRQTTRKPNIVLIMADDLGYGDIGCYGNTDIPTPNIDALAAGGMRFTDYHSNGAVCTPTRAALLTGRYQQRCGLEGVIYVRGETRQTGMDASEYTFARALQSVGYRTGIFGKWHLGYNPEYNPVHQGFDEFRGYVSGNIDYISHYDNSGVYDWWHNLEKVEEEGYCTDLVTEHTVRFIQENRRRPFCAYVPYESPHAPYQDRNDKADRFPNVKFEYQGSRQDKYNAYREMVMAMDDGVGRIMDTLREMGLTDHTLVFFCSDNGGVPVLGNNGVLRGDKGSLWEGGHRVPAIAYWPGHVQACVDCDKPVMSMDLMPTLLELAAAQPSPAKPLDGKSLAPVLRGESLPERALFWRYRGQKAVRRGKWKLLIDDDMPWLFDLEKDLAESVNLVDQHPNIASDLHNLLDAWEKDVPGVDRQNTV